MSGLTKWLFRCRQVSPEIVNLDNQRRLSGEVVPAAGLNRAVWPKSNVNKSTFNVWSFQTMKYIWELLLFVSVSLVVSSSGIQAAEPVRRTEDVVGDYWRSAEDVTAFANWFDRHLRKKP